MLALGSLAACTTGDADPQPAASTVAEIPAVASSGSVTSVDVVVDANDAPIFDVVTAFELNDIPEAGRWAREVVAYRPYDVADPTLARLRQQLVRQKPPPGVVDQIVASLSV